MINEVLPDLHARYGERLRLLYVDVSEPGGQALYQAAAGTLFSLYLTLLEPFVIGAACLWCLTSALLMSALFLVTVPRTKRAYASGAGPRQRSSARSI